VFTDVSADRAKDYLDDARVQQFKKLSYADDGVVMGDFHERNEGSAIYNASFHPFQAPVPFLLMTPAVVGDWKFFWTTKTGSVCGRDASASPRSTLWPTNSAAPTGGLGSTFARAQRQQSPPLRFSNARRPVMSIRS
jgi:hypothetical protein